jgi:alpha-L-fucosidase
MAVNGEGIHGSRPWKSFGDGPVATAPAPAAGRGGPSFGEEARKDLTADEVRFTAKGKVVYAFVMGWPQNEAVIKPLGTNSAGPKVTSVSLLGFKGKLQWTQEAQGLKVRMPQEKPCDHAIALKVAMA